MNTKLLIIIAAAALVIIGGCAKADEAVSRPTYPPQAPPGPPNAPTELIVDEVSCCTISLAWVDNSDDETGFRVFLQTHYSNGSPDVKPDIERATNAANDVTITISGQSCHRHFTCWVEAYNAYGASSDIKVYGKIPGSWE